MRKLILLALLALPAFGQHAVTLSWNDAINPTGTTYNVYRVTAACAVSTSTPPAGFTQIATGLAGGLSPIAYTDATVAAATTYCYVVTAVVAGAESAASNSAQAAEPGAFPPTMLQVRSIN